MRIGIATDFYSPWVGGPATVIQNLARGLAAKGHEVFLAAPGVPAGVDQDLDETFKITRARTVPVPFGYHMRAALLPGDVERWIADVQPDVLHIHHPFPLSVRAGRAAHRADIPVVATNHTIPACSLWGMRRLGPLYDAASDVFGAWIVRLLRTCSAVATPSDAAARMLQPLGYAGPVQVISNGIDTKRFFPGDGSVLRQRLGLDDRPVVLYTGRLDGEKDMTTWLRAASLLPRGLAQFVIGGEGTDRPRLEGLARELRLDDARFIGYLSSKELPDLYRLADIYCMTSPVELQSITTLEALASGVPAVAVAAAALPELVRDGDNGYLVPVGDAPAVGSAIRELASDAGLRRRMGAAARRTALSHSIDVTVTSYDELLEGAAGAKGQMREQTAPGRD